MRKKGSHGMENHHIIKPPFGIILLEMVENALKFTRPQKGKPVNVERFLFFSMMPVETLLVHPCWLVGWLVSPIYGIGKSFPAILNLI